MDEYQTQLTASRLLPACLSKQGKRRLHNAKRVHSSLEQQDEDSALKKMALIIAILKSSSTRFRTSLCNQIIQGDTSMYDYNAVTFHLSSTFLNIKHLTQHAYSFAMPCHGNLQHSNIVFSLNKSTAITSFFCAHAEQQNRIPELLGQVRAYQRQLNAPIQETPSRTYAKTL